MKLCKKILRTINAFLEFSFAFCLPFIGIEIFGAKWWLITALFAASVLASYVQGLVDGGVAE